MIMKVSTLLLIVCVICRSGYVSSNLVQPHHSSLRQKAEVACMKAGLTYKLTFFLTTNGDVIQNVYTVNSADRTDTSVALFSSVNGAITGLGTMLEPYVFTITGTVDSPNTPISLDPESKNVRLGYVTGLDVISVNVMSKNRYESPWFHHAIFPDDVIYTASCNFAEVQDKTATTGHIAVAGNVDESSIQITERSVLRVFHADGGPISSAHLGDDIVLSVTPVIPFHVEGVYVYSCAVCDNLDCSGVKIDFLDHYGCSIGDFISPFRRAGKGAVTNPFQIFSFQHQDYLFFRCNVRYCYDATDPQCLNYCTFNVPGSGRKKRQTDSNRTSEETVVSSVFRITYGDADSQAASQRDLGVSSQTNTALLATSITLASLLCLGLIVAATVLFRSIKHQKPNLQE